MVTTTAPEVQLTVSGRPKVPPLDTAAVQAEAKARVAKVITDAPNHPSKETKAALRALAAAEKGAPGYAELEAAVNRCRVEDLLTAAARLETDAMDTLTAKEGYMYRLAFSLALYEGVRGVNRAVGIGREAFAKRMSTALDGEVRSVKVTGPDGTVKSQPIPWTAEEGAALARRHRIARYGNAIHELPKVAREVALAHAIIVRVKPVRNEFIKELADMGATRVYIAGIIGREPSRVSHIVTGRGR